MKLHILSDLHLEHAAFTAPQTDADVVILAGDIAVGTHGVTWAQNEFAGKPVIYTPGNHEPYRSEMTAWRAAIRDAANSTPDVHLLAPGSVKLTRPGEQAVRVLGATLWTDFAVFGDECVEQHGALVGHVLADYQAIQLGDRMLTWRDTLAWHQQELAWLKEQCRAARARDEKVVVVTHHGPSIRSSSAQYRRDPVTAGFLSDLEDFVAGNVDVYFHGHVHNSCDYQLGGCRVVVNPRGYPLNRFDPHSKFENPHFNPGLVIEV
jgi:predicted phosphodiesterase